MEIKYYQKHSDNLFLAKKAFRGLCREVANEVCAAEGSGLRGLSDLTQFTGRFSLEAITILQMAAEKYISDELAMGYVLNWGN